MAADPKQAYFQRAVAMRYSSQTDNAPRVVAKGGGFVAEKILEIAREHNIPIHSDPDLIEVLAKVDVMEEIPAEVYTVVAEVLAYVYRLNKKMMVES